MIGRRPFPPAGLALRGALWRGGGSDPGDLLGEHIVLLDAAGRVEAVGPTDTIGLPDDRPVIGDRDAWVGPGIADGHVHLAFGGPEEHLVRAVVAVRDLGAPLSRARDWARGPLPVTYAGELLTAPGGYPSRGWGAEGFARFVDDADAAEAAVAAVAEGGARVIKLALEPRGGPVVAPEAARAVVVAAHARGLPVAAHALTVAMVERALDAGVDELAHTPTEPLPAELIQRLAASGSAVTSTLATFVAGGAGEGALANAKALAESGVPLRYGTDLGNDGTSPGADPRELRLLADAGLGAAGALRAATAGWAGRAPELAQGAAPGLVVLADDPLRDPDAWHRVRCVTVGGWLGVA